MRNGKRQNGDGEMGKRGKEYGWGVIVDQGKMSLQMQKLPRSFYERDTILVARELLGKYLVHRYDDVERVARIVEVEAYLGVHDLASHSSRGRTQRTRIMFGPPGHAYVYLIYGMYCCMNVVTEPDGHAAAVLLRAVEPVANVSSHTRGPGLLCRAMGIDRRLNGHDLESDDFFLAVSSEAGPETIVARPRVGVAYAGSWAEELLRFYINGNPFVSKR